MPWNHYITWSVEIPPNSYGACTRPDQTPLLAQLAGAQSDSADVPFRLAGPQPGQWTLTRDAPGFVMVALPQNGYALMIPGRGPYVGRLVGGAVQGGNVQLQMTTGPKGATSATPKVTAYDRFAPIEPTRSASSTGSRTATRSSPDVLTAAQRRKHEHE